MGSIKLTNNYDFILSVLNDNEMSERINEGVDRMLFTVESIIAMSNYGYFLGWFVENEIKGFYWVHPYMQSMLQIHAHFPLEHRKHSRGSGVAMLSWLKENAPSQYRKFVAYIPVCYPDVIGFSKREGLTQECFLSKSFNKGGEMIDLCILGICREDI